jgi:hypothetical protein
LKLLFLRENERVGGGKGREEWGERKEEKRKEIGDMIGFWSLNSLAVLG